MALGRGMLAVHPIILLAKGVVQIVDRRELIGKHQSHAFQVGRRRVVFLTGKTPAAAGRLNPCSIIRSAAADHRRPARPDLLIWKPFHRQAGSAA